MHLVKILVDEDGEETCDSSWHLVYFTGGSNTAFCTGQVFGDGEGSAEYEEKHVVKGITCKECIKRIKAIKSVKL